MLGGIPVIQTADLSVNPVIVIDPGVLEQTIDLTVADVEAAKAGSQLDIPFHSMLKSFTILIRPLLTQLN